MSREQRPNWQTNDGKYLGCQRTGNCCIELAILCKSLPLTAATTTTTTEITTTMGATKTKATEATIFSRKSNKILCVQSPKTTLGPTYLWLTNLHALTHHHRSCQFIWIYVYMYIYVCTYLCVLFGPLAWNFLFFSLFATRTTLETLTAIANLGQINRSCKELGKASSMCQLKCQFVGQDFQDIDGTSDKTQNTKRA